MLEFNLPSYTFHIKKEKENVYIFDKYRSKYVRATPEEMVRQHFCEYLVQEKHFPKTLLFNECMLHLNNTVKRCDTVVYNTAKEPVMIIEYKAPHINITQKVFDQITVYNMLLHVDYLVVSNGLNHYICKMDYDSKKYLFLEDIPDYDNILQI